jgi:hypothetical protein
MEELRVYLRAIYSEWMAKRLPAIAAWEAKWSVSFQAYANRARANARRTNITAQAL